MRKSVAVACLGVAFHIASMPLPTLVLDGYGTVDGWEMLVGCVWGLCNGVWYALMPLIATCVVLCAPLQTLFPSDPVRRRNRPRLSARHLGSLGAFLLVPIVGLGNFTHGPACVGYWVWCLSIVLAWSAFALDRAEAPSAA